jgi:hypothetical protein
MAEEEEEEEEEEEGPSESMRQRRAPTGIVAPSDVMTSTRTPPRGDGTSESTFSVETS